MTRISPELQRDIIANNQQYNKVFNYANNYIKTSKYTLLTFIPFNLFEQFQRAANFYFICLFVLQTIPPISSLTPVTTAVPLFVVLTVTALKDFYDDLQRHKTDRKVNNRKSSVLRDGFLVEELWHRVQVGDVIRIENNSFIAADILLLSSFNPNGLCYIETAELDGETNLKVKQCLDVTNALGEDEKSMSEFDGHVICEAPNNNLAKFEGTLDWRGVKYPLDNEKVLLRGAVLRNTRWCYGLVLFAGKDTKLMQNSGRTKFKRTSIDRLLNFIILGIVIFLFCICFFCTVASGVWESYIGFNFQIYLPWDTLIPSDQTLGSAVISMLVFFSYAIALNTVVPISLYVSVEIIRLFLSKLIDWDVEMYYGPTDTSAHARTTTLNEELGQIQYIFSDKTGTLTQNIMTFNKCTIAGIEYGDLMDDKTGEPIDLEIKRKVDFSRNEYYEPSFNFYDVSLLNEVNRGNEDCQMFFRILALCHTVMPDYSNGGKLEYQAQSPDENALVSAARNFGFVFKERTSSTITIETPHGTEMHELLCILDFNNVRKRMSVILRHKDKIQLYCKGADNVIFERLASGQEQLMEVTQDHLQKFAGEGLRTLVLGVKNLSLAEFQDWKAEHHKAAISLQNREQNLDDVYNVIEKDLTLIGATAIEDKLQDGVSQTIANLETAGIKIWVLTGDKQETAINIGYSCNLLSNDLVDEPYIVDGRTFQEVENQLINHRRTIEDHFSTLRSNKPKDQTINMTTFSRTSIQGDQERSLSFALVVNGHALAHALQPQLEDMLMGVAEHCSAVICCRVTPLQKALVVELVKKSKDAVSLAIGDGANDVSMIKAADIGVGISGMEGRQAVLASDYSIAQFRFLERLLLVHGRWSYYRMCKFLRYFFYKNFAFTLCHFWYAFSCGFSAQIVLDPAFISVYNLFYTSQPVLFMAYFDQDVKKEFSTRYPKLYYPGMVSALFSFKLFTQSALHGFLTSLALFAIPLGAYHNKTDDMGKVLSDHFLFGSVVATILVLVVTAQIALDTQYWTVWNHVTIWGSVVVYFGLTFAYNWIFQGQYIGSLTTAMQDQTFWFVVLLTTVVCILPVVAYRFYKIDVTPTLTDRARLLQRSDRKLKKSESGLPRPFSGRRSRRSVRSGYAFSHAEGFGRLITSGRIINQDKNVSTRTWTNGIPRIKNGGLKATKKQMTNSDNNSGEKYAGFSTGSLKDKLRIPRPKSHSVGDSNVRSVPTLSQQKVVFEARRGNNIASISGSDREIPGSSRRPVVVSEISSSNRRVAAEISGPSRRFAGSDYDVGAYTPPVSSNKQNINNNKLVYFDLI